MNVAFNLVVCLGFLLCVDGLKCVTCYNAKSFDECDANGRVQNCRLNQNSCETVVRRYRSKLSISKGCKNLRACKDNQIQNSKGSGRSFQCNPDQANSICTCCCDTSFCNTGTPTCTKIHAPGAPALDCPSVPKSFAHGKVQCVNDNKPSSVCEYQCVDTAYSVWPKGRENSICLTNGSWTPPPCCARPCPPFYLMDAALLYHVGGENKEQKLKKLVEGVLFPVIEYDSVMLSAMYYSGRPIETSVIHFNEYGTNATHLLQLIRQRITVDNEGSVNTGLAMRYAMRNLLNLDNGMRDSRVPKAIVVYLINAEPEDDVKSAMEEATNRGIQVYVLGYQTDGFRFNRQKLVDVTGKDSHLFIFDKDSARLRAEDFAELDRHFCENPCDHVLHEHE